MLRSALQTLTRTRDRAYTRAHPEVRGGEINHDTRQSGETTPNNLLMLYAKSGRRARVRQERERRSRRVAFITFVAGSTVSVAIRILAHVTFVALVHPTSELTTSHINS